MYVNILGVRRAFLSSFFLDCKLSNEFSTVFWNKLCFGIKEKSVGILRKISQLLNDRSY